MLTLKLISMCHSCFWQVRLQQRSDDYVAIRAQCVGSRKATEWRGGREWLVMGRRCQSHGENAQKGSVSDGFKHWSFAHSTSASRKLTHWVVYLLSTACCSFYFILKNIFLFFWWTKNGWNGINDSDHSEGQSLAAQLQEVKHINNSPMAVSAGSTIKEQLKRVFEKLRLQIVEEFLEVFTSSYFLI